MGRETLRCFLEVIADCNHALRLPVAKCNTETAPGSVVGCYRDRASLLKKWVVRTIRQGGRNDCHYLPFGQHGSKT
jgi:hypothetical protein